MDVPEIQLPILIRNCCTLEDQELLSFLRSVFSPNTLIPKTILTAFIFYPKFQVVVFHFFRVKSSEFFPDIRISIWKTLAKHTRQDQDIVDVRMEIFGHCSWHFRFRYTDGLDHRKGWNFMCFKANYSAITIPSGNIRQNPQNYRRNSLSGILPIYAEQIFCC